MLRYSPNGAFVINILDRQHSSWQGTVTMIASGEKQTFKSALDLMKIIDTAMDEAAGSETMELPGHSTMRLIKMM